MEKKEPINGYEKYSEWFKIIEKMCDETHFIKTLSYQDNEYYPKYQYYKLDNGLHVYKKDENIIISDEEIKDPSKTRCMSKSKDISKSISINTGESFAKISYGPEGTNASVFGRGKDYSFLPLNIQHSPMSESQNKYEITGDISIDMRELLSEAMDKAEEENTRKMYEKTIEFYDKISNMVELDKLNEINHADISKQDDNEMFSRTKDFNKDELEQKSIEDLQNMLKSAENENNKKREELENLKKQQLILAIKKVIEEGEELDSKIAEARTNNLENR